MAARGLSRASPEPGVLGSRSWQLVALLILFTLLYAATGGVARAMQGPAWSPLWQAALIGMLAGWSVGALRFPLVKAVPALTVIGAALSFLLGGRLGGQIGAVLAELNRLAVALPAAGNPLRLEYSPLMNRAADLGAAAGVVAERVWMWLGVWQAGNVPIDPVATTIIWAWAIWAISAWAGWSLREQRDPLLAALPAVVITAVVLTATGTRFGGLYMMLGALLLLVAAVQHEEREERWQRDQVAYPSHIGWDIGKRSMLVACGIVLLTALVPSISLGQVRDWITPDSVPRENSSPSIAETLGLRREPVPQDPLEDVRRPGLPREHLIGTGPELSDQHVLRVKVEDLDGGSARGGLPALYWRALTYDVYTGRGWRSSGTTEERYQAEYPIRPRSTSRTITLGQQVELIDRESSVLLAAGELISVDRPFAVARRDPQDVFAVTAQVDEIYRVVSAVPSPGEEALRAAGTEYPDSVRRRFLQLPDDLPERVRSLALQQTAAERTAYDRARALESYLRQYPYNLKVDRPPLHQDVVDFFLFDERQGYCDYYASSMAVMARASGIPARLAIGYASGEFDPVDQSFLVTEAEAHSWVELYFPEIGWVPFEPTAGRPALARNEAVEEREGTELRDSSVFFAQSPEDSGPSLWRYLLVLSAGLLLFGLGFLAVQELRLGRGGRAATSARLNHRLRRIAGSLSVDFPPGATPVEVAELFKERLDRLTERSPRLEALNRGLASNVDQLTEWIIEVQFKSQPSSLMTNREALSTWRACWLRAQLLVLLLVVAGRTEPLNRALRTRPWRSL